MRSDQPSANSYEAALEPDQRAALCEMFAAGATLHEIREKAPPWPCGPEAGKKPSLSSLVRWSLKLRLRRKVDSLEEKSAVVRVVRDKLKHLTKNTDEEILLDQLMALIGHELIDGCLGGEKLSVRANAAWLLLRRAELRRYDQRMAPQMEQRQQRQKSSVQTKGALPPMDRAAKAEAIRRIFGMKRLPQLPPENPSAPPTNLPQS